VDEIASPQAARNDGWMRLLRRKRLAMTGGGDCFGLRPRNDGSVALAMTGKTGGSQ